MYDLIIIGGGPAGLTAAVYAMNKRLEAMLVSEDLGGKSGYRMQLAGLEGYETINGEETVRKFMAQVGYVDFARETDTVVGVAVQPGPGGDERFVVTTASGKSHAARAVIVATGARPRALGIAGEQELRGRGVGYSAVSHAPLYWGRDAAVVGSGELALRSAAELATVARQVYLVASEALPDDSPLLAQVAGSANVTVLAGYQVVRVEGGEFLSEMTVQTPAGATETIPVTGLFAETGWDPISDVVGDLVTRNAAGHIQVDARMATSRPGIFAAGDVTDAFGEQVLIAIGDGAKAALAAFEYLLRHPRRADEPLPAPPAPLPDQDW
jgi:thioredoxin reductase